TEIGRHVAEVGERRPAERRLRPIELDDAQRRRQRDEDGRYVGAQERMPADDRLESPIGLQPSLSMRAIPAIEFPKLTSLGLIRPGHGRESHRTEAWEIGFRCPATCMVRWSLPWPLNNTTGPIWEELSK